MDERKLVRPFLGLTAGLYVGAFALLSAPDAISSDWVVFPAVVLLGMAALLLHLILGRAHDYELLIRRKRLCVWIILFGVGVVVLWLLDNWKDFVPVQGAWGLGGVCAMYLGTGQLLHEVRAGESRVAPPEQAEKALGRGLFVSAVCALLFVVGLAVGLLWWVWGLVGVAAALLFAPIGLTLVSEGVLRKSPWWMSRASRASPLLVVAAALWLVYGLHLLAVDRGHCGAAQRARAPVAADLDL